MDQNYFGTRIQISEFQNFLGTDCRVLHERAMCANERCDDFVCYTGFKKAASSACTGSCKADICEDIDECAAKLCPANANCLNTEVEFLFCTTHT